MFYGKVFGWGKRSGENVQIMSNNDCKFCYSQKEVVKGTGVFFFRFIVSSLFLFSCFISWLFWGAFENIVSPVKGCSSDGKIVSIFLFYFIFVEFLPAGIPVDRCVLMGDSSVVKMNGGSGYIQWVVSSGRWEQWTEKGKTEKKKKVKFNRKEWKKDRNILNDYSR